MTRDEIWRVASWMLPFRASTIEVMSEATMQIISRLSVMMRDERENRRDISGGGRRPRRLGS